MLRTVTATTIQSFFFTLGKGWKKRSLWYIRGLGVVEDDGDESLILLLTVVLNLQLKPRHAAIAIRKTNDGITVARIMVVFKLGPDVKYSARRFCR